MFTNAGRVEKTKLSLWSIVSDNLFLSLSLSLSLTPAHKPTPTRQLLTACERTFGAHISHTALTDIRTVEDAASYWVRWFEELAVAREREQQHWTRAHPPNVRVLRGSNRAGTEELLAEWIDEHGHEYDYAAARLSKVAPPPF